MSELDGVLASFRGAILGPGMARPGDADVLTTLAELLDGLGLALCAFDDEHRTLLWNRHFLTFFPEHRDHVHVGEPYQDNLRRFYDVRLVGAERAEVDRYIAEGVSRHDLQVRPFSFQHHGRHLRVGSAPLPDGSRVRVWQSLGPVASHPGANLVPGSLQSLADHHADGFAVLDDKGRVVSANDEFLRLYGLFSIDSVTGKTLADIVADDWARSGRAERPDALLDNSRFAGSPFEVELPGERWRRVVEHRLADGTGYSTHSDISVPKRLHRELTEARETLRTRNSELAVLAGTDPLTGVANRRAFDTLLTDTWARASASGQPMALLLIDVDHFKQINDAFGHPRGDLCLQQIAAELRDAVRAPLDIVARYGGEEFAVILPDAEIGVAAAVAERIRSSVACKALDTVADRRSLTVSVGAAATRPTDLGSSPANLIDRADRMLYSAKRNGRNRVEID